MSHGSPLRVLFTGYAPVHFLCFRPVYERIARVPQIEVFLSGGLRSETESGMRYDLEGMYGPLGVPRERLLSVDEMRARSFDVVFAANTKMLLPRAARARVQIFHGISFRNKSVRVENAGADFFFLVGPYMRAAFAAAGLLPEGDPRALSIGFPKTDRLRDGTLDRAELLAAHGFDGRRPVVLYAPTGERHNSLETMGEQVIARLAETQRYDVLVKPHDHPKHGNDWFARLAPLEDEHVRVTRELDVIPLLFLADLLVTDASSVSSEYALLDRPMVFLDVPELLVRAEKSGSLDLVTWGRRAGAVAQDPARATRAVESALADPTRGTEIRRAMADDLFYHPGRATDAAVRWFLEDCAPGMLGAHAP